jgi:hypothetical protein
VIEKGVSWKANEAKYKEDMSEGYMKGYCDI